MFWQILHTHKHYEIIFQTWFENQSHRFVCDRLDDVRTLLAMLKRTEHKPIKILRNSIILVKCNIAQHPKRHRVGQRAAGVQQRDAQAAHWRRTRATATIAQFCVQPCCMHIGKCNLWLFVFRDKQRATDELAN